MSAPRTWIYRLVTALVAMTLVLVGLSAPAAAQEEQIDSNGRPIVTAEPVLVAEPVTQEPVLVTDSAPPVSDSDAADGREPVPSEPTLVSDLEVDSTQSILDEVTLDPILELDPIVSEPVLVEPINEPIVSEPVLIDREPVLIDKESVLTPEDIDTSQAVEVAGWDDASLLDEYDAGQYTGSMWWVTQEVTGAAEYWTAGYTGEGVDVAIIDTGVSPVRGLNAEDQLIYGPDLSFESQNEEFAFVDTFGHGTHLAGIIAGRDGDPSRIARNDNKFLGMAPDARLVSVKVGTHNGAVDVSQVIAAIDWVVEHRTDNGLNIRVLNLSYGTDSTQDWKVDPLSYAVERAWDAGIVVVVSAGNDGNDTGLRNPATNPHVIAVGASESNMSYDAGDDHVTQFSNCSTSRYRPVDVVAPGKSIVSLRAPGSTADLEHPEAQIERRYFLGSGTSQAAAVVSGAAALIIDQHPNISPDQVKALLKKTAQSLPGVSSSCQGEGLIDLKSALDRSTPWGRSPRRSAEGTGSLEASRGSIHIQLDGVILEGEQDIFGQPWHPENWIAAGSTDTTWTGGEWNDSQWTGDSWSGLSWGSDSWAGLSWGGLSWGGLSWGGLSWGGLSWGGLSWGGLSWGGLSWGGLSWASEAWS